MRENIEKRKKGTDPPRETDLKSFKKRHAFEDLKTLFIQQTVHYICACVAMNMKTTKTLDIQGYDKVMHKIHKKRSICF